MARHTFTDANRRQWTSNSARPYFVRCDRPQHFGSLPAARTYARQFRFYAIFFDYAPGTGAYIEGSTR